MHSHDERRAIEITNYVEFTNYENVIRIVED